MKKKDNNNVQRDVESAVNIGFSTVKSAFSIIFGLLLSIFVVGIVAGCIVVGAFIIYVSNNVSRDVESISLYSSTGSGDTSTRIYYYDNEGNLVEDESQRLSAGGNVYWASYDELPDNLINAFIAIEDKRFWDHNGFDLITTSRAVLKYFLPLGESGGGSTITQQLIKNSTGDDDYTIQRKVQEILRAVELEKKVNDKTKIFEMYVNIIYLSQGATGVQAAAHKYFNKNVSDLSLVECAAIAGITQYPTKWDPIQNPENNKYRRQVILTQMYVQGLITKAEYDSAYNEELVIDQSQSNVVTLSTTSWYTDAVINEAINLIETKLNVPNALAKQMLYTGGYSIVTAQDKKVQTVLDKYFKDMSKNSIYPVSNVINVESAMIIMDPHNGNILAMVGGRGEKERSRIFNLATQAVRQPGSSFKPVAVYGQAMEAGIINYGSVYDDIPFNFGTTRRDSSGKIVYSNPTGWPRNSDGAYRGKTTMEYAIAESKNTIAVHVLNDVGLNNSFNFLTEKLHLTTLVNTDKNYASLGLGGLTYGVTLEELTAAYSIFSNNGIYTSHRTIIEIRDNSGNTVIDNSYKGEVVISEGTSQVMTKLLQQVILNPIGTASSSIRPLSRMVDVAGKTGTTNNNYDKWFIGYTPYYLAGVWVGYEESQDLDGIISNEHNKMWNAVMCELHQPIVDRVKAGKETLKTFPDDLLIQCRYCMDSGKLISEACNADPRGNRSAIGYYTAENLPSEECDCHVLVKYCIGHGVAGPNCPDEECTYVGLIRVKRSFPNRVYVTDGQYTYVDLNGTEPYRDNNYPFYWRIFSSQNLFGGKTRTSSRQYNCYCLEHN